MSYSDDTASRLATGIVIGSGGVASSFMPAKYVRAPGRQAIVTAASALAGFGFGALVAAPAADAIGGDDALRGGLLMGGAGLATALAGRHLPNAGSMRDAGRVVASIGTIAAVGGGAVVGTEALDRSGAPLSDSSIGVATVAGVIGGTATAGVLALRGGYRPAATVAQAARSVLRPTEEALSAWTPELARADYATRTSAAKELLAKLPGADASTWERIGKGRSFLRNAATTDDIRSTMNVDAIRAPRRLLVATTEASTPEARAALMLERFDAAGGVEYGTVHVISPTAIADTNEVVPLAVEHATRGNVITLMTQTSQSEPYFVLHKVGQAQKTLDLVLRGIQDRIEALPAASRPKVLLSALCYGSLSPVELGADALKARGVQHMLLEGAPALRREARALTGRLSRGEQEGVLAFSRAELDARVAAGGSTPSLTMLMHRDDPLRVGLNSVLVPASSQEQRPFVPVMSAINAFGDFGVDSPRGPGTLLEVGHQFAGTGVASANTAFGLGLTPARIEALEQFAVLRDAVRGIGTKSS
jgi:hypothetical protein